jgi:hypothetical protein
LVKDASGNVGIGTSNNNVYDQIAQPRPLVVQKSDASTTLNGSLANITIVNGDTTTNNTAQLNFAAITGASTNQYSSASISTIFGARTNTVYPSGILTFSTSAATQAPAERARIDSSGNVLVTNPAGLGYGTGSGGTVTQATNKGTAVTLNKPTGQITMNNAALLPTTSAFFDVNNSLVSGTDNVLLTISNFSSLQYSIKCHVSAGKFTVVLTNETAGSLSDAVVFNFGILKGATT